MRLVASILASFVIVVSGCSADDKPLFAPSSTSSSTSSSSGSIEDAGVDMAPDAIEYVCEPDMGQTACDQCVYAQCCARALTCAAGTPCGALWTCTRLAGCLDPQASDFDTCAVDACPTEATASAVAEIEALAECIRAQCDAVCGGQ